MDYCIPAYSTVVVFFFFFFFFFLGGGGGVGIYLFIEQGLACNS